MNERTETLGFTNDSPRRTTHGTAEVDMDLTLHNTAPSRPTIRGIRYILILVILISVQNYTRPPDLIVHLRFAKPQKKRPDSITDNVGIICTARQPFQTRTAPKTSPNKGKCAHSDIDR